MAIDSSIYGLIERPDWGDSLSKGLFTGQTLKHNKQNHEMNKLFMDERLEGQKLNNQAAQQALTKEQAEFQLKDAAIDAVQIKKIMGANPAQAQRLLVERINKIKDRGGDPSDSMQLHELIRNGNIDLANTELDAVIDAGQRAGLLSSEASTLTAGQREFRSLTDGLSEGDTMKARRIELGLDPRASISADERIAGNRELTSQVAESKAAIKGAESGASEQAKLNQQLAIKPKIQAAIKEAEMEAASNGEQLTELARAKAVLPGLEEVSTKLKSLSEVATYTTSGKIFNALAKELGFSTKGGTARAQMISIVDNQVLPLLKDTFGAQFTAAEGDRLRDALLDPNQTPEAKKAQLDAFYEQKIRDIEVRERQLRGEPGDTAAPAATNKNTAPSFESEDAQAMEWARQNPNDPRAQQIMKMLGGQ